MKKLIIVLITTLSQQSYAAAVEDYLNQAINAVKNVAPADCSVLVASVRKNLKDMQEYPELKTEAEAQSYALRGQLFSLRLELHAQISKSDISCVNNIKTALVSARALEDLVGLYGYRDAQLEFEKVDFQHQPIPLKDQNAYRPHHGDKTIKFLPGDIMITKGISFLSSTISQLPDPTSLFSHIVFVHVDDSTGTSNTIESYVGSGGVTLFDMDFALKNENARILVLRQGDKDLGKRADDYIMGRINEAKKKGKQIPYDYALDFNDNSKMSCEEIAYDSYKQTSHGNLLLPAFPATITRESVSLMASIGLKKGVMMTPADMESDPRFEVVYDFTDFRFMRDSWRKDAVLSEIFRWMDQLGYEFKTNLSDVPRDAGLGLRNIPGLGWAINKLKSIDPNLPNDAIVAKFNVEKVGAILTQALKSADERFFTKTGMWMSERQLREALETIRLRDLVLQKDPNKSSLFHEFFAPHSL